MDTSVEESWRRISALLSEHAPMTAHEIRPAGPAEDVRRLQRVVGLDFPADLLAWWAVTDGVDDRRDYGGNRAGRLVPNWYIPLAVTRAEEEFARQSGYPDPECCNPDGTHSKPAGETGFPYCTALVPLCRDNGGALLCVDLRQGEDHGWIMEWTASEGFFPSEWDSVAHMLAEIAERLDNGVHQRELPYGEQHPVITEDGMLAWP